MPRPGPRPYVCERRVWHSERHQPMRGSLIQEIFRLVNEHHTLATKKNKEWQEKLPVVVLKAEEILYSKANSEEEYMDIKTLWDRTTEAINIIIRRDESTETGKLLQPCIEAALHLGCTPRRTSRSERNNPILYLSSVNQKAENSVQENLMSNSLFFPSYPGIRRPRAAMNNVTQTQLGSEPQKHIAGKSKNKLPFAAEIGPFPPPSSNSYPVYPHHYGNHPQLNELQHDFGVFPPNKSASNMGESSKMSQYLTHDNNLGFSDEDFTNKINLNDHVMDNTSNNQQHEELVDCDLSLRLGPVPTPSLIVGSGQPLILGFGSSTCAYLDRSKFSFLKNPFDRSSVRVGPIISSPANEWRVADQSEPMHLDGASMRKRKTVYGPTVDGQFRLPPKLPYSLFPGKMKTARS